MSHRLGHVQREIFVALLRPSIAYDDSAVDAEQRLLMTSARRVQIAGDLIKIVDICAIVILIKTSGVNSSELVIVTVDVREALVHHKHLLVEPALLPLKERRSFAALLVNALPACLVIFLRRPLLTLRESEVTQRCKHLLYVLNYLLSSLGLHCVQLAGVLRVLRVGELIDAGGRLLAFVLRREEHLLLLHNLLPDKVRVRKGQLLLSGHILDAGLDLEARLLVGAVIDLSEEGVQQVDLRVGAAPLRAAPAEEDLGLLNGVHEYLVVVYVVEDGRLDDALEERVRLLLPND